jgi:hypothetical protein
MYTVLRYLLIMEINECLDTLSLFLIVSLDGVSGHTLLFKLLFKQHPLLLGDDLILTTLLQVVPKYVVEFIVWVIAAEDVVSGFHYSLV